MKLSLLISSVCVLRKILCRSAVGILIFVLSAPCVQAASSVLYAGYRTLSSSLPAQRLMIHMGVWYPTNRKPGTVKVGDWSFRAARNAPIAQGPWPLIVLSHDVTGSAWSHHDLASALAAHGFIVAAPTHDHDNDEDMSLLFADRELPVRALQIRAALDLILEHPQLGEQTDRTRIGFLGFGLPASAGLLLAGAELDPYAWDDFCHTPRSVQLAPVSPPEINIPAKDNLPEIVPDSNIPPISVPNEVPSGPHTEQNATSLEKYLTPSPAYAKMPQSPEQSFDATSPWCRDFLAERMTALTTAIQHRTLERTEKTAMMQNAAKFRKQFFHRLSETVSRSHQRQLRISKSQDMVRPPVALPLLPPLSLDRPVADARIRAVALVSPGYSMLFSPKSLSGVSVPSLFIGAGKDPWLIPEEQAERFVQMMENRPEYLLFPQADTASLQMTLPSDDPASALSELTESVSAETRAALHLRLASVLQDFFSRTLTSSISK